MAAQDIASAKKKAKKPKKVTSLLAVEPEPQETAAILKISPMQHRTTMKEQEVPFLIFTK